MKRVVMLITALLLMVLALGACGAPEAALPEAAAPAQQPAAGGATDAAPAQPGQATEPDRVVMAYLFSGMQSADLFLVQDELNNRIRDRINVEVEFLPISTGQMFGGTYQTWIGAGDRIDLMTTAFMDISGMVNSGMLLPIDDLLDNYAPSIRTLMEYYPLDAGAVFNGVTYGVSNVELVYGWIYGMIMHADKFAETGFPMQDFFTWEDMTEIFQRVRDNHPHIFPYNITGSTVARGSQALTMIEFSNLGAHARSGVLMSPDSTTIVNLFATDIYRDYLALMRDWHERGFILPDAATTDALAAELLISQRSIAYSMALQPWQTQTYDQFGWDSVALPMTPPFFTAIGNRPLWMIPVTAEEPAAAMRLLELMYYDYEIQWLLHRGIYGTHWEWVDRDRRLIRFPDGIDVGNTRFWQGLGIYGNRNFELNFDDTITQEAYDRYNELTRQRPFQCVGYTFNPAEVQGEITAVTMVLERFLPSLETGSVADWEAVYEEMLAELATAGIYRIIEENQRQFDTFRASR